VEDGGTNWLIYVCPKRSDALKRGLIYSFETTLDLVYSDWTNANYEVLGVNETGEDFDYVTNRIPTIDDESFIKMKLEINP
jgi:hypothetical protein